MNIIFHIENDKLYWSTFENKELTNIKSHPINYETLHMFINDAKGCERVISFDEWELLYKTLERDDYIKIIDSIPRTCLMIASKNHMGEDNYPTLEESKQYFIGECNEEDAVFELYKKIVMWDYLDNSTEYLDEQEEAIVCCDGCAKDLDDDFYVIKDNSTNREDKHMCHGCYNPDKIKEYIEIELIDRRDKSEEEKPRIWSCNLCKFKLGGGFAWYCSKIFELDFCLECCDKYNFMDHVEKFVSNNGSSFITRSSYLHVNIGNVNGRKIPKQLLPEITKARVMEWCENMNSLVNTSVRVGNLKNWTLFTDFYEIPIAYPAEMALAVDCSKDDQYHGRVASVVIDDHGRSSMDIVFNSFDEYLDAKNTWESIKLPENERALYEEKIRELFRKNKSIENEDILPGCKEFACYCRINNNLPNYYG